MATAELRWAPHPFRGGFCIKDVTDAAELASVRAVYDCLGEHRKGVPVQGPPHEHPSLARDRPDRARGPRQLVAFTTPQDDPHPRR